MVYPNDTNTDPLIGQVIDDRYLITKRIGSGAMGAVYRAEQIGLERSVALKLLTQDANWTKDTVLRFQREAQAASALTHPNTVRVFDFGATHDGILFLVMEILEGEPVTNLLRRNQVLGIREAIEYGRQILHSLAEAHTKGIIHRDIKPDNVFLADVEGQDTAIVKILDFGIAKAIAGERTVNQFETQDGTVFGTPRYMSPEQAQGKSTDARSDLYAVGITLFEFLAGYPPFIDKDAVIVMAKHIREHARPLRRVRPDRPIPASLERVVQRALKKNPARRFQTADEFARALENCLPDIEHLERAVAERGLKKFVSQIGLWSREKQIGIGGGILLALATIVLFIVGITNSKPDISQWIDAISTSQSPDSASRKEMVSSSQKVMTRNTSVLLESEPSGVDIWYKGKMLGVTPFRLNIEKNRAKTVRFSKTGYTDFIKTISADKSLSLIKLYAKKTTEDAPAPLKTSSNKTPNRLRRAGIKRKSASSPYEKFD